MFCSRRPARRRDGCPMPATAQLPRFGTGSRSTDRYCICFRELDPQKSPAETGQVHGSHGRNKRPCFPADTTKRGPVGFRSLHAARIKKKTGQFGNDGPHRMKEGSGQPQYGAPVRSLWPNRRSSEKFPRCFFGCLYQRQRRCLVEVLAENQLRYAHFRKETPTKRG